jgi:hypothetical protein
MREFTRPPVACPSCGANIYFNHVGSVDHDPKEVISNRREPPDAKEKCPKCSAEVDTVAAYAFIPGFPPSFAVLKTAYSGFVPAWEHSRESFEVMVRELFAEGNTPADLETEFSIGDGWGWYRQRLFYRSCTAFYRSLQLFFAYLVLERRCFRSWATVTGYYSRFFFIQALLNLMLTTFDAEQRHVFFYDGKQVRCLEKNQLSATLKNAFSHEAWWQLMEAIKIPADYDPEHFVFVLSRLVYSPHERNRVNYGFEYLRGGFIELDWFDSGAKQLLSHFMPHPRADRDVTDLDRYFQNQDPGSVDVGDFYGDEAQMLWCSIKTYLEMITKLAFKQQFVLVENIAALAEVHLADDYPNLMRGILVAAEETLKQGFDVEKLMAGRAANPDRISSFYGTASEASDSD